jgi:hypothetical protein
MIAGTARAKDLACELAAGLLTVPQLMIAAPYRYRWRAQTTAALFTRPIAPNKCYRAYFVYPRSVSEVVVPGVRVA